MCVRTLSQALNLPVALAAVLVQRGYHAPAAAAAFLRPSLDGLTDPFQLPDMSRAVELLVGAVGRGEGILVHGDYDVDGQCASALLTRTLRAAGARVIPFVPHRLRDGYDFGPAGLAAAQEHRAAVIVTCDCGTTAQEAVARAKAAGHTVIITDHHLPGALPPADAIVNPRREGGNGGYRDFCGAGVAFKLAQGLVGALGLPSNLPYHLLDLVALATVA
ncbi:MAG: DHH family phosphoesterase, partial [Gemmatimonadetes bacterium]|nr:DHH family phosphoesterase [Gemmatimonadota bacterium]